jgi:hypothetical protein
MDGACSMCVEIGNAYVDSNQKIWREETAWEIQM